MKTYFQISLKVFTVLLTVMLVCVGCGKNGNSASGSGLLGGVSQKDMSNPAERFTEYKPIYEKKYTGRYYLKCINILDANGEVKYSDEEAEKYYSNYAAHFLCACIIADKVCDEKNDAEMRSYMEEHLFDVVCNLPLGDSYPSDVREIVNKIYYDYKDRIMNMSLENRGYGYLKYKYDTGAYNQYTGSYSTYYLKISREQDSGTLTAFIY